MKPKNLQDLVPVLLALGLFWMGLDQARAAEPSVDAQALFSQHCAACHGVQRLGAMGPALLPESLARMRKPDALRVIQHGRAATQMPGFAAQLKPAEIEAVAALIYQPLKPSPQWSEADVLASRTFNADSKTWPHAPQWRADAMNLFVVVEAGDHHISLLDGDRFELMHRFPSRFALHGGPKFTPDGRYVFFGSRDGWITKYDLWNLQVVAEVRAGLNMRNLAVSGDGKLVMAANYLPHTLVVFDADLNPIKQFAATTQDGRASSRVSAVYDATPRQSFIVALKDIAEIWEISYNPRAEDIYDGLVHDYKFGEGVAKRGYLNIRRTQLAQPLDDFFFDQSYAHVLGAGRPAENSTAAAHLGQVVNLDVRRSIATLPIPGMPHLGSGITFEWQGRRVLASPNLKDGLVTVIDLESWQKIKDIATPGPGFFMRSHAKSRYAWVDSMMSANAKDTLTIIDKQTLETVAQVKEPGKTIAHIEFSKDGRYALASVTGDTPDDGAILVLDAATFKEIKRLPMRKPVGKYNVWNKISRDEGTSH